MNKPTLVIGDVHGHYDRLEALLVQEGILGRCPVCDGTGDTPPMKFTPVEELGKVQGGYTFQLDRLCGNCDGEGIARINHDVQVVQLGDLGHWGGATGSPSGDKLCYQHADQFFDIVLWGNHDRALVDSAHIFGGYQHPGEVKALVDQLYGSGKLRMAVAAHGYLIVHAGVHLGFKHIADRFRDAPLFAEYLNSLDQQKLALLRLGQPKYRLSGREPIYANRDEAKKFKVIDNIGWSRGGRATEGGVLWMDWRQEKHLRGEPFKYICGHTADRDGLIRNDEYGNWNIDIGGKTEARLGGVWLDGGEPRPVKIEL